MRYYSFLFLAFALFGCRSISPNRMFQTPKDYAFAKDTLNAQKTVIYQIQPFDKLEMHLFSNDGFKLVDIIGSTNIPNVLSERLTYQVDENGDVRLPLLGLLRIKGLTVTEAQTLLEEKYSKYYNHPFIIIQVTNRHVLVFNGDSGQGKYIALQNDNTNLFEALAQAGGLTELGKAYRIKIIRGEMHNPQIYLADIYSIEGLKNSELKVLSNDIIYVEGIANYKQRLLQQVTTVVGLITAVLLVINIVNK